jgi:hypothetical protein
LRAILARGIRALAQRPADRSRRRRARVARDEGHEQAGHEQANHDAEQQGSGRGLCFSRDIFVAALTRPCTARGGGVALIGSQAREGDRPAMRASDGDSELGEGVHEP